MGKIIEVTKEGYIKIFGIRASSLAAIVGAIFVIYKIVKKK